MALSRQSLSPTANLLRNSRLFSLPNPLPRPPVSETFGAGISKSSDTATLPYPTHQAITTTKSSLARGDWGLKRPLPSRSHLVQTSDPVLRVTQLDTIEDVTDFDSAADHVRTRQKFEEMGVPMMKGMSQMRDQDLTGGPPAGAFELRDDTTSYDTDMGLDEAGLNLKALRKSIPTKRANAEWDMFHASWKEKWEAKKAAWRSQGWGTQLEGVEEFAKEAQKAAEQVQAERTKAFTTEWEALRAPWDEKWAARREEWKALSNPSHPDRVAGKKALKKEMAAAKAALERSLSEKKITTPSAPWLDDFLAFQKEHATARKALRQKLSNPSSSDFTPFTPPGVDPAVHNARRGKHDGPWLPGMGADDFTTYLYKSISSRKAEFTPYLYSYIKNEIYTTRRLQASKTAPLDAAEAETWHAAQEATWSAISEADIQKGIKSLRLETATSPLTSKLVSKLILPFLKLPPIKFKNVSFAQDSPKGRDFDTFAFDPENAPLSTHPSAGLSYLRSKSYLSTHPILGPQALPTPIAARVLQARRTGTNLESYARLGIAGFTANDQFRATDAKPGGFSHVKDVETIDVDTPGGRKIMTQPLFAAVTNDGRVHVKLVRSTGAEVAVGRGEMDDRPPVREGFERDPLSGLVGGMGRSGVRELDEGSGQARLFSEFLEGVKSPARAQPGPGFPGVGDALRGE